MSDVLEVILFLSSLVVMAVGIVVFARWFVQTNEAAIRALELDMHRRFPKGSTISLESYGLVEIAELYPEIKMVHVRIETKQLVSLSWDSFLELARENPREIT